MPASSASPAPPVDVLIAGGGVAGLSLALALKTALSGMLSVTLCDPALASKGRRDDRAFAIAAGPRRMLETLGVWEPVSAGAQPILEMVITDSRVSDPVRPVFLTFGGEVAPGEPFAHMVEHAALLDTLTEAARAAGVDLRPTRVTGTIDGDVARTVQLASGEHRPRPPRRGLRRRALAPARGGRHRRRSPGPTSSPASSPRSRMSGTTRAARRSIPAVRPVRDPAFEGQAVVDRLD